ncbi:MAG: radical SAM protein, partial [Planctomycetes bacterium]|nr:radical SAM protein [Planctomycetota bacterium]
MRRHKRIDSWFVSRYGLNQYRGCTHNCAYCDGRAEGYYVEGEFGRDISIKTNSADLLRRELDPARKRKPLPRGFIMLGGGVGDSYQPVETKYRLTRGLLQVVREFDWPVHILTKSVMVERDLDLLTDINHQSRALVSFSLSTIDDKLAAHFEPGVPSPTERLATLKRLHAAGISGGVFLMPVIPFVSDLQEQITEAVAAIKTAGADFIIFGGMTLKEGRQKQYFLDVLKKYDSGLLEHCEKLYGHDKWGSASSDYYQEINTAFINAARVNQIPVRIPQSFFDLLVDEKDKIVVLLDQMDY